MNYLQILELIAKYATYIPILLDAGKDVLDYIERIKNLAQKGADGTLTDAEIMENRQALDEAIAEFNADI